MTLPGVAHGVALTLIMLAVPSFWMGILLILVFGFLLKVLPPCRLKHYEDFFKNWIHHFEIPQEHSSLLIEAVSSRDYPVITGIFLVIGVCVMLINLLVDLSYGLLDPRIRVR